MEPEHTIVSEVTVQEILRMQPGRHDLIVLRVKGPEYPPSNAYRTWLGYMAKQLRERCGFDGVLIVQDQHSDLAIYDQAVLKELYTKLKEMFESPTPGTTVLTLPAPARAYVSTTPAP